MLSLDKLTLKKVISEEFGKGINKISLFEAVEDFINTNYLPRKTSKRKPKASKREATLSALAYDIRKAGGMQAWKDSLIFESQNTKAMLAGLPPPEPETHSSKKD